MLVPLFLAFLLLLLLIYFGTKQIRYGSGRELVLNLFCTIQGRKHKWVTDPCLARRILQSSISKGMGIEQLLSTQAFLPIISLESVNDNQWRRMKENFLLLKTHLPSLESLANIAKKLTKEYLESEQLSIIDCNILSKLIVEIMTTWLFGESKKQEENDTMILVKTIDEFRKEIAIKGKGSITLKLFAVTWIKNKIMRSKYYDIFKEKWELDEFWSLFLQPFIVSPVINITDLAVTLTSKKFKEEFKLEDMEKLIYSGINYNHPFPVLERWFPDGLKDEGEFLIEPNTQVFIPIDKIGRTLSRSNSQSSWTAFGAGGRACAGKEFAITLTVNMFQILLTSDKFKPWLNHKYSGRDNDEKETWEQTWFQTTLLVKILWRLALKRMKILS